jgi:hypothetical protein
MEANMKTLLWIAVMAIIPLNCDPLEMPTEAAEYQRNINTAHCEQWFGHAIAMGWELDDLSVLDQVMWNESRCDPTQKSDTGDHGLTQINWRTWAPLVMELGYEKADLYHPAVNLLIARQIYEDADRRGWCPWKPWYMSGNYTCTGGNA